MIELLNEEISNSFEFKDLYIYEKIFSFQFNPNKILNSTLQYTCKNMMSLEQGMLENYINLSNEKKLKIKNNNYFNFIENLIPKSNYLKQDLTLLDYYSYKPFNKKLVEDDLIFKFKFEDITKLKSVFNYIFELINKLNENDEIIVYLNKIINLLKNSNEIIKLELILFLIKQTFENTDYKLLEKYLLYFYIISINIWWEIDIVYPIINFFYLILEEYKYDKIKILINLIIYSLRKIIFNSRLKKYNLSIYEINNIINLKRSIIMINFFNGFPLYFYYDNNTNFNDLKREIFNQLKLDYIYLNNFGFTLIFSDKNEHLKKRLEFKNLFDFEYISDIIYLIENKIIKNHKFINIKIYFTLKIFPLILNNIFKDFIYLEFLFLTYNRMYFTKIEEYRDLVIKMIYIDSKKENIEYILNNFMVNYYHEIYYKDLDKTLEKTILKEKFDKLDKNLPVSNIMSKELNIKNELIENFLNKKNKFLISNLFNVKILNSNFIEIKNLKNNLFLTINNHYIVLLDNTFRNLLFEIDLKQVIKWTILSNFELKIIFILDFEEIYISFTTYDNINIGIFLEYYCLQNIEKNIDKIDENKIIERYNYRTNLENFNFLEDYY